MHHYRLALYFLSFLLLPSILIGQLSDALSEDLLQDVFQEGLVVDLRNPTYSDGMLTTTDGGVISSSNIRIQAQCITYRKSIVDGQIVQKVDAEGNLMVEYGCHVFVGERMDFDFEKSEGYVYGARGVIFPWFVGGSTIHLTACGEYVAYNAFLTTSANRDTEWQIESEEVHITQNSRIRASNVQFRFINVPLLWIPTWSGNINTMWRMPIRYHARWSGRLGPRIGMSYLIYGTEETQAYALLDYSFLRGLGGGIETDYRQTCGSRRFSTRNYIANDSSVADTEQKERYRIAGVYHDEIACGFTVDLTYDKLSDKYMATDYDQRSFQSRAIGRSQLAVRQESCDWLVGAYAHARLNDFQSVKQELPTLAGTLRPIDLLCTGVLSETQARASYLSYRYDKELTGVLNYQGTRIHLTERLYRPFSANTITLTPEVSLNAIYYGDGPNQTSADQIVTGAGFDAATDLYRHYGNCKHSITPYFSYRYFSASSNPITDHYLFDIDDGWTNLQTLRIGTRQSLYQRGCETDLKRRAFLDLYTVAFPQTSTIANAFPYLYGSLWWYGNSQTRYFLETSWDTARSNFAYFNFRTEFTVNANLAMWFEYRHRTGYAWRKVDYENFFIDAFYQENTLLASTLSDPRDTVLGHIYYRFHPTWAIDAKAHYGWNRPTQRNYLEHQTELTKWLRAGWLVKLIYQHREDDSRFSVGVGLGATEPTIPCFETPELAYGNY